MMVGKGSPKRSYRKSPSRTETKSPSRSTTRVSPLSRPALRKSPSRTVQKPTTPRSPSRKSPARKSPSRVAKDDIVVPEKPKRISRSQKPIIELDSESEDSDSSFNNKFTSEKPKATVRGRARKLIVEGSSSKTKLQNSVSVVREITPIQTEIHYVGVTRRSVSKSQPKEIDHIDLLKRESLISSIQKLTELSDEDDVKSPIREKSERRSVSRVPDRKETQTESQWLTPLLLTVVLLLFPIVYYVFCNEVQCQWMKLPNLSKFMYSSTYFDSVSFAICSGFGLLVVLVSAIPFGGFKISGLPNKQGKLDYVMNGMLVAITVCTALAILEFYNVPVIQNVLSKYFQLIISLLIIGCILSIWLYIRSFYVPLCALKSDVLTSGRIYNFFNGRELNPRLFNVVDVKMCLFRFCIIGSIMLNGILIYKDIEIGRNKEGALDLKTTKYNLTLIVVAITQIIYLADSLAFETTFVTTSSVQYDAVGFLTASSFTYGPILMCAAPKYIYDYGVKLPLWHLMMITVIFCAGYFLYRASNLQKHAFRQNPYHPTVSHLESLPTSQGKKLLVSGYWGWVRHPNYLGDIIMNISFGLCVYNAIPVVIHVLDVLMLVQRAQEDGVRCKHRYGSAWERYCQPMRQRLKHFIKYCCKPFAKETTIHGVSFLNVKGLHPLERLFWLIAILLSAIGATSLIISNWNRYNANPTVISIQKDYRNWKNLLPTVTGCFLNKTNLDLTNRYVEKTWGVTVNDSNYEYYAGFVKAVANISYYNFNVFTKYENDSKLNEVNLFDLATEVHPQLSGTLVTFDMMRKSYFTLIMTEMGICFTINSKFANILALKCYSKSNSFAADALGDANMVKCHYLNGLCYARYDSDPLAPINFYAHSYLDVVHATSSRPFYIGESEELEINYLIEETTPSPTLRNLSPSQRKCRFDDEPLTEDIPVYSPTMCYISCRYRIVMQRCKCRPFFYHFMQGKVCNISGMICISKYAKELVLSASNFNCYCPQPCHIVAYLPLPPKSATWTSGYFDQRLTFRWGLLHPTTKYRRDVLFSFEDLVGSLGGSLCLFLGISFISLIEIVFFIFNYIIRYCLIRNPNTIQLTKKISVKQIKNNQIIHKRIQ
ncbi:hypothetical protein RN001_006931 [Aquatica leii]|uniref:Uncharacterized protein n=1 Tax=Aquatica leii TaxID=1421715 RepID=A0AAN7Q6J4_9COLE|nr:hypothetical protein RN001_006931 [Aquatica leii]